MIIDESHNLRNRDGKRYRAIHEYVQANDSKCILLTATPYNKTYLDLANQLRLFVPEDADLGIRPERLLRELGETEFIRRHQAPVRSLAAFEHTHYADDWRDLMRLYLVRRTRSFIQDNYAETDDDGRKYLTFEDGTRSYFPARRPITVEFGLDDANPDDQYAPPLREGRGHCHHHPPPAAIRPRQLHRRHSRRTANSGRGQDHPGSRTRWEAIDGLQPHQPVQAARERRNGIHSVRRAARPAQLHLPARARQRSPGADRHPGRRAHGLADQRRGRRDAGAGGNGDARRGRGGRHSRRGAEDDLDEHRAGLSRAGGSALQGVRVDSGAPLPLVAPGAVLGAARRGPVRRRAGADDNPRQGRRMGSRERREACRPASSPHRRLP